MKLLVRVCAMVIVFGSLCGSVCAQRNSAKNKPGAVPLLPSEELVNAYMHRMFGYDPQITWKVLSITESSVPGMALVRLRVGDGEGRLTQIFVSNDMQHGIVGEAVPFGADPFRHVREELASNARGPSLGAADAPVVIVEFSDLQCPHCKAEQPTIDKLVAEVPNSRLIFQHFPLQAIHKWAFQAASYAQCVADKKPRAFWSYIRSIYDNQLDVNEQNAAAKLKELVGPTGLKPDEVGTCASSIATQAAVSASLQLGERVGVDGTPTLFINGRKIPNPGGIPYDTLKRLVLFEAEESQKASHPGSPTE